MPRRFAHGYQVLADATETTYLVSEFYAPGQEGGLRFDDPRLGISWPLPIGEVSPKDQGRGLLADVERDVQARMAAG